MRVIAQEDFTDGVLAAPLRRRAQGGSRGVAGCLCRRRQGVGADGRSGDRAAPVRGSGRRTGARSPRRTMGRRSPRPRPSCDEVVAESSYSNPCQEADARPGVGSGLPWRGWCAARPGSMSKGSFPAPLRAHSRGHLLSWPAAGLAPPTVPRSGAHDFD